MHLVGRDLTEEQGTRTVMETRTTSPEATAGSSLEEFTAFASTCSDSGNRCRPCAHVSVPQRRRRAVCVGSLTLPALEKPIRRLELSKSDLVSVSTARRGHRAVSSRACCQRSFLRNKQWALRSCMSRKNSTYWSTIKSSLMKR